MKNQNFVSPYNSLLKIAAIQLTPGKEDKYRAIVENSVQAFFLSLPDGTILETNRAASAMFGYSVEEFKYLKSPSLYNENDPVIRQTLEMREKNGFVIAEVTGIKKGGEHFPIEISSTIFSDANGERRTSTMVADISVRKATEAAMRLSNERYDLVVKATNDLVWDWDLQTGEIYRSGNSLDNVYGHKTNEAIKSFDSWAHHLHPLDKERIEKNIDYYIHSKDEISFNFEYRFRREDGTYAYISDKGYIIRNEEGKAIRMIGAAEDITQRIQLEKKLSEEKEFKQQQITEAVITGQEKERTQLGEELHDNINQILASTKLYIECALKDEVPRKDLIEESRVLIEKAMVEIRSLSKSLLPPSLGEVGLLQALNEMTENIQQVNEIAISIEWNKLDEQKLPNKLKLTIFRIVQEQLNNIIKHARARYVLITLKEGHDILQVSIKDDGKGFDTTQKRNGVGLRNITSRAEVNSGMVIIDSRPGAGCELLVSFALNNILKHSSHPGQNT